MKKILSTMAFVLTATMSIAGFTSCKDNKEPEPDSLPLIGKWQLRGAQTFYSNYVLEFTEEETYSYVTENESINGVYKITGTENTTCDIFNLWTGEYFETVDATRYKMLVSGSNVFDQLWVYYYVSEYGYGQLVVHLYSGNELVQKLGLCSREPEIDLQL